MASDGGSRSWGNGPKLAFGIKAIGNLVPEVTRKAFERHGFPAGRLAADWTAIVGPEIARYTRPEKIKWPRPFEDDDGETAEPAGATLVLRVEGARALEMQYRAAQIMEKINGFLGYRAITEIRLIQAPIVCRINHNVLGMTRPRPHPVMAAGDPAASPLANALERLAQSVAATCGRNGQ